MPPNFHELVRFPNGTCSVKTPLQAMHSSIGPWAEANEIYVAQSGLRHEWVNAGKGTGRPLVLYDVGMGLAANALAAIEAAPATPLHLISFENTVDGLEFALSRPREEFPFLARHEEKLRTLLSGGAWSSSDGLVQWDLFRADFRENLAKAPSADLVFYDFYSPAVCPELWTAELFGRLREKCHPGAKLITYVAATAVRSALLLGGFAVGRGKGTEAKRETTIGTTEMALLSEPLRRDWLLKLKRSSRPWPLDVTASADPRKSEKAFESLERLPQFQV